MGFKRQEEGVLEKRYYFDGELRVQKKVMNELIQAGTLSDIITIVEDVRKRAGKEGLTNPIQYYKHDKLNIELIIRDKISKTELDDPTVEKLFKSRNHYCSIKLA